MRENLSELMAEPLTGVILGLVTFAIGTALSFILYRRARAISRLEYLLTDTVILGVSFPAFTEDLEIRFRGTKVPQVVSTIVGLWNNGNQTILGSQIVEADPLRLGLPEGATILQANIYAATRPVVDAQIIAKPPTETATIMFDYLDPGDGFVINIVHSGKAGDANISGSIRGVHEGLRRWKKSVRMTIASFIGTMLGAACIGMVPNVFTGNMNFGSWQMAAIFGLTVGFIIFSVFSPTIVKRQYMRKIPRRWREEPNIARVLPHLLDG